MLTDLIRKSHLFLSSPLPFQWPVTQTRVTGSRQCSHHVIWRKRRSPEDGACIARQIAGQTKQPGKRPQLLSSMNLWFAQRASPGVKKTCESNIGSVSHLSGLHSLDAVVWNPVVNVVHMDQLSLYVSTYQGCLCSGLYAGNRRIWGK